MSSTPFYWPVRIYYEDTDAGGIVYNANYLKFMERARTEWLRSQGIEQDGLLEQGVALGLDTSPGRWVFRTPDTYEESVDFVVKLGRTVREKPVPLLRDSA